MKNKNQTPAPQPNKFNLIISAILILSVLALFSYDVIAEKGIFSCPNFVLYIFLSYGIAAASVYLTGYITVENSLLKNGIRAGGALGVLVLCFSFLFSNYENICWSGTGSKYAVTITASKNPKAGTKDIIVVNFQDTDGANTSVEFDAIERGESKTDTMRNELKSPIVNVEIFIRKTGDDPDMVWIDNLEIKGNREIYGLHFLGITGGKFGISTGCKMPIMKNQTVFIGQCD